MLLVKVNDEALIYSDDFYLVGEVKFQSYKVEGKTWLCLKDFEIKDSRHGYGSQFIKEMREICKKTGDMLFCFVDRNNYGAIRFFKRNGGTLKNYDNKQYLVIL